MNGLAKNLIHVERILNSVSVEQVWAHHLANMQEFGFDRVIYTSTRFRNSGLFGDLAEAVVMTNHDRDYIKTFTNEGLYRYSPSTPWLKANIGAISWRIIAERFRADDLSDSEKRVKALYAKWNTTAGYTIGLNRLDNRNSGVVGLTACQGLTQDDADAIWQDSGAQIILLNNLMHLRISTLPNALQNPLLTTRQLEVLRLVADGKSNLDIVAILEIALGTVEKHLRMAREALNVDTTAQAVLKASLNNQLFLQESYAVR